MPRAAKCSQNLICVVLGWALTMACQATDRFGTVSGTVTIDPAHPIALTARYRSRARAPIRAPDPPRAIVYLARADGVYPNEAALDLVEVSQEGYQFRPGVIAVRAGTPVGFPNRDDEFHSVFSYSQTKRFDLGRFRKDEPSPSVVFDEPGLVKVYCEIHKHMRGFVLVLDTPWFAATDADGNFVIADVPPGEYRLRAFLPTEATLEQGVTISAGQTTHAEFRR